jgi:hypothetical protein
MLAECWEMVRRQAVVSAAFCWSPLTLPLKHRPLIQDELHVVALYNTSFLLGGHLLLDEDVANFSSVAIGT